MASKDFVVKNGLQLNGPITLSGDTGTAGQILTSDGNNAAYWTTPESFTTDQTAQYSWTNTHTFSGNVTINGTTNSAGNTRFTNTVTFSNTVFLNALSANGTLGTAGQVLTSNGSDTYWSNVVAGSNGTSIALSANNTDTVTYYFPMSNVASGTWSNGVITNTKLYFVPSTGTLAATVFNSLSDLQYKTDVTPITNAITTLKYIDGVSFKWKDTGHKSYGVIAQEVEKVLPEIVDINNDVKSVNYQALIGFLIEAVKELSERIEKLENGK